MVDLDYRINSHAHSAGLKRLSARAAHHHAVGGGATPNTGGRRVFFSFAAYARTAVNHLRNCQVQIEKGLTDEEFAKVEAAYGFTFPPDLRAILQEGLPVGAGFPNWRHGCPKQLQMRLDLPVAGLLYEVARSKLWWKQWGPRPADTRQAVRVALWALRKAPVLIPVYSHCFIPASPNLAGNPVFFVYQRDVFISGIDIADFFQRDRFTPHEYEPPTNLPNFMSLAEEVDSPAAGTGRVMRMGSGRDLLKERVSAAHGKENLMAALGRVNLDNGVLGDVREQEEGASSTAASSCRVSDASRTDRGCTDESCSSSTRSSASGVALEREVESWGRNVDTLVAKHSSEILLKSLDNFGRRPSSKSLDHHNSNGSSDSKPNSPTNTTSKAQQQQQQNRRSNYLLRAAAAPPAAGTLGRRPSFGRTAPTSTSTSTSTPQGDILAKLCYFEEKPLPAKTLIHFSLNAPPWAPKAARRIDFWTELTEKRQQVATTAANVPEALFSAHKVDSDVAANFSHHQRWEWEDRTSNAIIPTTTPGMVTAGNNCCAAASPNGIASKEALSKFRTSFVPKWVVTYLDDISLRLRKGGWQEDDISDIMESKPPLKTEQQDQHQQQQPHHGQQQHHQQEQKLDNKQSVLDALARQAEILSSSLREAGWSIRDVAEVLDVDLTFGDHRRTASKLSPELAVRLSTFAEYVVNA